MCIPRLEAPRFEEREMFHLLLAPSHDDLALHHPWHRTPSVMEDFMACMRRRPSPPLSPLKWENTYPGGDLSHHLKFGQEKEVLPSPPRH